MNYAMSSLDDPELSSRTSPSSAASSVFRYRCDSLEAEDAGILQRLTATKSSELQLVPLEKPTGGSDKDARLSTPRLDHQSFPCCTCCTMIPRKPHHGTANPSGGMARTSPGPLSHSLNHNASVSRCTAGTRLPLMAQRTGYVPWPLGKPTPSATSSQLIDKAD